MPPRLFASLILTVLAAAAVSVVVVAQTGIPLAPFAGLALLVALGLRFWGRHDPR